MHLVITKNVTAASTPKMRGTEDRCIQRSYIAHPSVRYVIVITQDEYMISLLLHKFEAKPRMSVNKKDIIRIYLGYNCLITQKTLPIS